MCGEMLACDRSLLTTKSIIESLFFPWRIFVCNQKSSTNHKISNIGPVQGKSVKKGHPLAKASLEKCSHTCKVVANNSCYKLGIISKLPLSLCDLSNVTQT